MTMKPREGFLTGRLAKQMSDRRRFEARPTANLDDKNYQPFGLTYMVGETMSEKVFKVVDS